MEFFLQLIETERERQLFTKIYEANRQGMYRAALKYLKNKEEAENAVHDAFVKIAEDFDVYKGFSDDKMKGACITIAKCRAIDIFRKRKHLSDEELENLYLKNGRLEYIPEEALRQHEIGREVKNALDKLPEILRETLVLKYMYDLSMKDVARVLDVSVKLVDVRLDRGKKKMREYLEEEGYLSDKPVVYICGEKW